MYNAQFFEISVFKIRLTCYFKFVTQKNYKMQYSVLILWLSLLTYFGSGKYSINCLKKATKWDDSRPSWTPDGKSLVFGSNRDGNKELYIMNVDGTNQRNLTNSSDNEMFPAVSPDGKTIAYLGEVDGNYDIYTINIDGSNKRRLTTHAKLDDWPVWIDEGKRIVFDSDRSGSWGIYVMNADGSNQEVLIDTDLKEIDPTASPIHKTLIYSCQQDSTRQLLSFDLTSKKTIQLTHNELINAHPALDHSGSRIAYNAGGKFWDIFIMQSDGTQVLQLTKNQNDDKWPAWSPDDKTIAFTTNRNGNWEIYLMTDKGDHLKRLTYGSEG